MQDKSLFPRLRNLFSTDVVIRNIGGGNLKVLDPEKVMSYGSLQTNTLIDRFSRLYRSGQRMQFNPNMNYQTMRVQLYSDYEAMDTDPIVAGALDIIAAEATLKSEMGEVLGIRSTSDNVQRELYNLFYDVLNIEHNLPMWIRSMAKYGDAFLKMDIMEDYGIIGVRPLSVYDMMREEGMDPNNPSYIRYIYDPGAVSGGAFNTTTTSRNKSTYENYEIAHFRYLMDTNYLPMGRSHLEPARKAYKQYVMAEDAMLLHRIMRSADKRIFYVNVGGIPPAEVPAYMQSMADNMKKTPYIDPQTGDYNLKFNIQNMLEDFFIPRRPNDNNVTQVQNLPGLEYSGIDDVNYLLQKLLSALRVPKAFLNYSDELNGKSTLAGLSLTFSKTIEHIQRITLSELKKIAAIHLYVKGYEDADMTNFQLSLTVPSILYEQEKIALLKEKVDLAGMILDKKLFSTDWIYDKIFDMSEDQLNEQRELIAEDVKRMFRNSQIENEGNDPAISGVSYGTPHDLATIYKANASKSDQIPPDYDEELAVEKEKQVGRPKEKVSAFGTDNHYLGRDPLGMDGIKKADKTSDRLNPNLRGGPLAMESMMREFKGLEKYKAGKTIMLYENKEDINIEEGTLLDEKNILED